MPREFRRIVTTNDANGKSELIDGPATHEFASIMNEMWVTVSTTRLSKSLEPPATS